jgi:hypothetical protein
MLSIIPRIREIGFLNSGGRAGIWKETNLGEKAWLLLSPAVRGPACSHHPAPDRLPLKDSGRGSETRLRKHT